MQSTSRFLQVILCSCSCLVSLLVAVSGLRGEDSELDFRDVKYRDLMVDPSTQYFKQHGVKDFGHIAFDKPLNQIIVGARDHLLRLNISDFRLLEQVRWSSDNATVGLCLAKGQHPKDCRNVIRVVLIHGDVIFVCGTNAYSPKCAWRKRSKLSDVIKVVSGVAKCPYDPHQNNTYLMTSDGSMYTATVTDFTGRDSAIYRSMGQLRPLRTVQYNSRWLNDPDFVSSHEIDDFVYFFFRETAVEYINCGKVVYSRVGRVCKNDAGGRVVFEDNWTTFVKSRLNCSVPGEFPFYYNELQSTHYIESEKLVYAVFTTSPNAIHGSAICVFNYSSILHTFNGPFKFQENAQSAWTRVPNYGPLSCGKTEKNTGRSSGIAKFLNHTSQRHLVDVQNFQMMDVAVQPVHHRPPIVVDLQRFTHIVVDRVAVTRGGRRRIVDVVFLSTLEGVLQKYVVMGTRDGTTESCLVERINLRAPAGDKSPGYVRTLRIDSGRKVLIVGTLDVMYSIPLHRCGRLDTKQRCLEFQDPYCGWDADSSACVPIGHPDLQRCSKRTKKHSDNGLHITSGKTSDWTTWTRDCSADDKRHFWREKRTRCSCQPLPVLDVDWRHCSRDKTSGVTDRCVTISSPEDSTTPNRTQSTSLNTGQLATSLTDSPATVIACPRDCCRRRHRVEANQMQRQDKVNGGQVKSEVRVANISSPENAPRYSGFESSLKASDKQLRVVDHHQTALRSKAMDHYNYLRSFHHKDPFTGFCRCRDLGQLRVCSRC